MLLKRPSLNRNDSSESTIVELVKYSIQNVETFRLRPDIEEISELSVPNYDFHIEFEILVHTVHIALFKINNIIIIL
jgi:hypothetical protein